MRVQADRRLVEDVSDVCEGRAEVPDHLGALGLSPGQRARRPVQREVAQSDFGERVEQVLQAFEERRDRRLVETADPPGQVADLHPAQLGDVLALDLGGPGLRAEPRAVALRAGLERDGSLHEGADVRLHRLDVLGEHRFLDLRDQALVRQIDALDLDLGWPLVEEIVHFLLGELLDRLVHVEAGAAEDAAVPAVHAVAGDRQRTVGERLAVVVQRGEVEVGDRAHALATRTHPAQVDRIVDHVLLDSAALLGAHHPAGLPRRDVEGERRGGPHMRGPQPAEEDPEHGVRVSGSAHRGAGVRAHPLLVDDDRRRQPLEVVHVRTRQVGHEPLHEGAVRLVDHPLRLSGDGGEDQRALAGAGNAGEHRQTAFGDLDADVFEVVFAGSDHADQIVAVGNMQRTRLRFRRRSHAHRVSIPWAGPRFEVSAGVLWLYLTSFEPASAGESIVFWADLAENEP